jgi:Ca-activated chloride channel family protein
MISFVLAATLSWPGQYNAGVTAYRSNEFSAAATTFEQASAAPDRALQERALYNLGNAAYRLGQANPTKAQQLWQRAEKSYESALAIDPQDGDAKFNYDFVKKKLEELEKQKQRQQQQNKQQQNKRDQQDQKQEQDKQQQQQQEQKQPDQKHDQQQQQPQPEPQDKPDTQKQQDQPQQAPQPNNLDKQQAAALLDNLREEERNWNFFPEVQMKDLKDAGEPAKDW